MVSHFKNTVEAVKRGNRPTNAGSNSKEIFFTEISQPILFIFWPKSFVVVKTGSKRLSFDFYYQ